MQAAVLNFAVMEAENKTLIIGDMLELGGQSDMEHQRIVDLINENGFSDVYLVGKCFQAVKSNFIKFADVEKLKEHIQNKQLQNRFILIKGSHGIHLEKIISEL